MHTQADEAQAKCALNTLEKYVNAAGDMRVDGETLCDLVHLSLKGAAAVASAVAEKLLPPSA